MMDYLTRWLELVRAWRWVPTNESKTRSVWTMRTGRWTLTLLERERLYFGRWGQWRWRAEHRWINLEEAA